MPIRQLACPDDIRVQGDAADSLQHQQCFKHQQPAMLRFIRTVVIGRRQSSAAAGTSGVDSAAMPAVVRDAGRKELEVVFLGTGAAIPAKYRNVSGIYVDLFEHGGIMLDCGAPDVPGTLLCPPLHLIRADSDRGKYTAYVERSA